jgi:hypothetical protein
MIMIKQHENHKNKFASESQTCGAKLLRVSALLTTEAANAITLHGAREVSRANPKGLSHARLGS